MIAAGLNNPRHILLEILFLLVSVGLVEIIRVPHDAKLLTILFLLEQLLFLLLEPLFIGADKQDSFIADLN